jgi:hypothetical protein
VWPTAEEEWSRAKRDLVASISVGISRVHAVEHTDIKVSWDKLHQVLERCRLAEERAVAHR